MKWDRGGREAAGDVATGRLMDTFQFGDVSNVKETIWVKHK